ncbi:hypothetical protein BDA99DRAFT_502786 [Phascolomyces articulosus]|uniref:RING-CH-type domain-containing protein n=1 Tax=Phascolomyces articulosus TaxID=60185 RepID=A0AAD5K4J2_9FUNG|nr:hypothetical protein BDA99DRAFT_502786 [Phascolomyces articulosus]
MILFSLLFFSLFSSLFSFLLLLPPFFFNNVKNIRNMTSNTNNNNNNSNNSSSSSSASKDKTSYSSISILQQPSENNDENKNDPKQETVALLEAEPPMVSIAMTDPHDQQDEYPKTCRICGEGENEEDEEEDIYHYEEEQLYPENTSMSSSSYHPTQNSNTATTERHKPASPKTTTTNRYKNNDNPLIRPCKCKGSMMYVHIDCLNRWRELSPRQESHVACDLCGYRYNIYRPKFAAIVSHPYFLRTLTLFSILLLTLGMAYLCKWIHLYILLPNNDGGEHDRYPKPPPSTPPPNHGDNDGDEEWWWQHGGLQLFGLDRVYLLAGLISVSVLGIIYLFYCCATASSSAVSDPTSGDTSPLLPMTRWLCCCDSANGGLYGCYIADFTTCSGDAALGGIVVFIAFVILIAIVFGILGVFSGIYAFMESIVQHVAGRVKERILDVQESHIL